MDWEDRQDVIEIQARVAEQKIRSANCLVEKMMSIKSQDKEVHPHSEKVCIAAGDYLIKVFKEDA